MKPDIPIVKDLVLLGGGHSHVVALRRFAMQPLPGVRITLINRTVETPYSGMLPGLIAGHYSREQTHIDLYPLSRLAGARFYHDEVLGLDLSNRRILCRHRPPVPFDVLSIDVGSTPSTHGVPGAWEHTTPVKPIDGFLARWEQLQQRLLGHDPTKPLRIGVVGGGAGGVELLLAVQHRLHRDLQQAGVDPRCLEFHLVSASQAVPAGHPPRVQALFSRVLAERQVIRHLGCRVTRVAAGLLHLEQGEPLPLEEILWVTQAGAAPWLAEAGLAVDDQGFVRVDEHLQSLSHPGIFAAGDVACLDHAPRPKAGVFAVRAGKPLADNLRRALIGQPLKPYHPQRHWLSLISTGDRYAVASRGSWSLAGKWLWPYKDWIDRRFMGRFQALPPMPVETPPPLPGELGQAMARVAGAASPMRCGGCGAKVGGAVLSRVLGRLPIHHREEILVGLDSADDAAVARLPEGKLLVQSVDFFRALLDDPYTMGQIAANHALNDLYAMGAEPWTALAMLTLPHGPTDKLEQTLEEILQGALTVLNPAGATLVGGHTGEGPELSVGFTVNGLVTPGQALGKAGLQPGDALILSKPLGTGTLFAAAMHGKARGSWIDGAVASMITPQGEAARILRAHGARACTDVTGFGLAGHLSEMTRASGVSVSLDLAAIPLLAGALESTMAGYHSTLLPANRESFQEALLESGKDDPRRTLLFDPQTAGGLLAGIPTDRADDCVAALRAAGFAQTRRIAEVTAKMAQAPWIRSVGTR